MKVSDFLDLVGNYLQEDYETSPVWTKAEVFGYLKQALGTWCSLTQLVDKNEIRLINSTTGEADAPRDFGQLMWANWELKQLPVVDLDELDFVSATWSAGTTGTPKAVSEFGPGTEGVVRYVPVPSSVWDGGESASPTVGLELVVGGVTWAVVTNRGVLRTAISGGAGSTPVIAGPTTFWDLSVDVSGQLVTTASSSTTADDVLLQDTVGRGYTNWYLLCTDDGALVTSPEYSDYGIGIAALVDNNDYQTYNIGGSAASAEYGIIVDAYATGSSTSPDYICRANQPYGLALYAHTSDETGMLWYKGALEDPKNYDSYMWLHDGMVTVLLHGVLALAFGHDGDGKDMQKARLMQHVFMAECQALKEVFELRWA